MFTHNPFSRAVYPIITFLVHGFCTEIVFAQESDSWTGPDWAWQAEISKQIGVLGDVERYSPKKVGVDPSGGFNLNLPLLTVPGRGGLNFELALNYIPGIKVMQEASFVGLGWNLNIGSITRNVVARCDREVTQKFSGTWTDSWDELRDSFVISCPAGSGTILQFPQSGNPDYFDLMLEEWRAWKITYDRLNHRFIVIVEDGTTYVFGLGGFGRSTNIIKLAAGEEFQYPNPDEPYFQWFLTAILSSDYVDGGGDAYNPLDVSAPAVQNNGNWIVILWDYDKAALGAADPKKWFYYYTTRSGIGQDVSLYEVTYPYRIVTPTHVAEFILEQEESNILSYTQDGIVYTHTLNGIGQLDAVDLERERKRRLESIKLRRYSGSGSDPASENPIQEITFSYYTGTDQLESRTTLKEVQIKSGLQTMPPYKMEYYYPILPKPNYNSIQISGLDPASQGRVGFWGWYNGNPDFAIVPPGHYSTTEGLQTDGMAWNLKKITYPTGGSIQFSYESDNTPHDMLLVSSDRWRGGCRLISQTIDDAMNPIQTFTYSFSSRYLNGTAKPGTGKVYISPLRYFQLFFANDYYQEIRGNSNPVLKSVLDHQDEWTVYYEEVYETRPDNSKTISFYSVRKVDDYSIPLVGSTDLPTVYQKTLKNRGFLIKREYYSSSNGKVREEVFDRIENIKATYTVGPYNYPVYMSVWKSQETITTTNYEQSGSIATTTTLEYNEKNGLLKRQAETNSDERKRITKFKYPVDYTNTTGAGDDYEKAIHAMRTTKYMFSPVIEKEIREQPLGQGEKLVAAELVKYKQSGSNPQYLPYEVMRFTNSTSVTDFVESNINGGTFNADARYQIVTKNQQYDAHGNLARVDDYYDTPTSTIWAYNNALPIAQIRNASPSQAAVSIFDDNNASGWSSGQGTWVIDNGIYKQTDIASTNVWTNPKRYDSITLDDAILEADIRLDNSGLPQMAGIYKYVDGSNYIRFLLRRTASGNFVRIQPVNAGDGSVYVDAAVPINYNQWYHLRGEIQGSVARLYLDGQLLLTFDHAYNDLSNGKIALGMWASVASYDNVRFYPPNALATSVSFDPGFFKINTKTDESGISTIFTYDAFGRLATVQDRAGNLLREADYFYSFPFSASNPNHVQEKVYRSATGLTTSRTYADGLGRPIQTQQNEGTGSVKTGTIYDELGRVKRVTKSFYDNSSQTFNTNPLSAAQTYYSTYHPAYYDGPSSQQFDTGQYPYAETEYFADPLDRVKRQAAPGTAFYMGSGMEVKFQYLTNASTDLPNDYPTPNVLLKQSREDENGYTTDSFHDRFGNLVATIAAPNGMKLTTVHTYDVLGNLVQTKAPTELLSTYQYNTLSQLTSKYTPDASVVEHLYDKNGNLRFVKDGKGSAGNTYFIYYKYDAFNRKIEEGTMANPSANFNQANAGNVGYPTSGNTVKVKFQYDFSSYATSAPQKNLSGRLAAIEYTSDRFTQSTAPKGYVFYSYNNRGRVEWIENWIPKSNQNDGNGSLGTRTQYEYDFQGNVTKTSFRRLFPPGANSNSFYVWYDYDELGRLKKVFASTADSKPSTAEAEYSYWPGGQIKRLVLGNNVQGLDYLYNSRDWLTQINHQNLTYTLDPGGDGGGSGVSNPDRFGQIIGYNRQAHIADQSTPFAGDFVAQYNGNISWTIHNTFSNNDLSSLTGWVFKYDSINRLTKANWGHYTSAWVEPTSRYDLLGITYDASGNLTHMKRRMYNAVGIDMYYHYKPNSNQLDYVENLNSQTSGNYSYDANGNLTADAKKLASAGTIAYNYRNLPTQVPMPGGAIAFDYDGNGQRISKNDIIYVTDAAGRTLAAYDLNGTHLYWNIWGLDLIGQKFWSQAGGQSSQPCDQN